jgi:hypothetical protein
MAAGGVPGIDRSGLIGAAVPPAELAPPHPAIDQAVTSDKPSPRINLILDRCVSIGNLRGEEAHQPLPPLAPEAGPRTGEAPVTSPS